MTGAVIGWVMFTGIAGFAIGFIVARMCGDDGKKADVLEAELEKARADASEYRRQVAAHFSETAHHFNAMTTNYRAIYEHLAKGAQALCSGEEVSRLTNESSAAKLPEALDENIDQSGQGQSGQTSTETNSGQEDKPAADNSRLEEKSEAQYSNQSRQNSAEEAARKTGAPADGKAHDESEPQEIADKTPEGTPEKSEEQSGEKTGSATKKQTAGAEA